MTTKLIDVVVISSMILLFNLWLWRNYERGYFRRRLTMLIIMAIVINMMLLAALLSIFLL